MIYGDRIKQVRELNGWTQTEVAAFYGVTQPFIAQIENGWERAPDDFMKAYVFRTGFPQRFFERPLEAEFPLGSLLFRAKADMTEREQKSLRTHASMAHEILDRMLVGKSVAGPAVRVPKVSSDDPERAATFARSELGLAPDAPVKNLLHVMESAGVMVIGLPRAFLGGDAFSVWTRTATGHARPVVVLSSDRPADRVRHSAAHELGHLVMHNPLPSRHDIHKEADQFAGAFLLPSEAMRQEIPSSTTLETFLQIKVKWGVSVQAGIVRAHHLGIITQNKYSSLFKLLSKRGWRMHEPLSSQVPLERPRSLRQIAEVLYGKRLDYERIASDVNYPEPFVRALFEAHAGREPKAPSRPAPIGATLPEPPEIIPVRSSDVLKFQPKKKA